MKTRPIVVDARRSSDPPGAPVEIVTVEARDLPPAEAQAIAALDRLRALRAGSAAAADIAVLAWHRDTLAPLRALGEARGLPLCWAADRGSAVAPWAIREVASWLDAVRGLGGGVRSAVVRADALRPQHLGCEAEDPGSPWWGYVEGLVEAWAAEVGAEGEAPIAAVLDFVFDCMHEDRRQRALGDGIALRTLHGAKGLEFDTVVLLDGGFGPEDGSVRCAEERRLFYVGATRARRRLVVVSAAGYQNPQLEDLRRGGAVDRRCVAEVGLGERELLGRRYVDLGLEELYLDFAARFGPGTELRRACAGLRVGDALRLVEAEPRLRILDAAGRPVGELSQEGSQRWRPRLGQIEQVLVRTVLRRDREQVDERYLAQCAVERWELPLLELAWRPSARETFPGRAGLR
jgi:ATP-dependent DNA helicase RecQ